MRNTSKIFIATIQPGDRLSKAYDDVTIQRYRKSHTEINVNEMRILPCLGSNFYVKLRRCPLKSHTDFWTHIPENMHFTMFQNFVELWY